MNGRIIRGRAYVLGDHIDTDQIISAEHLKLDPSSPDGYAGLGRLAMCGLPDGFPPFVDPASGTSPYAIIVAGDNFGCGSSREHAVIALGAAGVRAVVARSYARIFLRNCVSTGELLPVGCAARLNEAVRTGDEIAVWVDERRVGTPDGRVDAPIEPVGELAGIVEAGGLFAYARAAGRMPARAG
ncbi:3-isopropylmalate dehydratase small subunit [Pigmentiphaga soli]|uniref:3-isopropylmalate dehydratase n=1 Tax=Pigmentiphaga soli TaxID=1007095 RepID=A0ABP8GSI4_9BURK